MEAYGGDPDAALANEFDRSGYSERMFGLTQRSRAVKGTECRGVAQDATAPIEGVSNVEEPAFQPGTWSGWGLAVVFVASTLALVFANFLVAWIAVALQFPEARSVLGFLTLLHGYSHDPVLRALAYNPFRIFCAISIRSAALVGAVYGLRGLLPARTWRAFGFIKPTGEQILFGFVGIVPAIFGGAAGQAVFNLFVGRRRDHWAPIIATHHGFLSYVLDVLQGCVASPLAEETLFRGLLFAGLVQRMGPVPAALISSTLFGLVHLEPYLLPGLIITGVVLAYVYYHTRNIWAVIVTHAMVNWIAFTLQYLHPAYGGVHPG